MTRKQTGEIGIIYVASYALVTHGDKTTCAWCHKDVKEIKDVTDHIEAHAHTQEEYENKLEKVRQKTIEDCLNCKPKEPENQWEDYSHGWEDLEEQWSKNINELK